MHLSSYLKSPNLKPPTSPHSPRMHLSSSLSSPDLKSPTSPHSPCMHLRSYLNSPDLKPRHLHTHHAYTSALTSILQISMPGSAPAPSNASSTPNPIVSDQCTPPLPPNPCCTCNETQVKFKGKPNRKGNSIQYKRFYHS